MTPWRHRLRRARLVATTSVAVLVIALAVAVGLVQLLLPLATHYPDFIARQLSARLHRPVTFAAITSEWQPSGPLLIVRDLTLGPGEPGGHSITLPHAALKFDFSAWLRPARRWITLRLSGMELQVRHSKTGWEVAGFRTPSGQSQASLQSLPVNLDLRDLRVDIVDEVTHRSWQVLSPRLRVVNVGATIRFAGSLRQLGTRQGVTLSGSMNAGARDYAFHVSTGSFDFAEAARGVDLHGYAVHSGRGDVELWGNVRDGQLMSASARYAVDGLALSGPDGRHVQLATLAGVLRVERVSGGWNVAWRGPGKARADIDEAGGLIARLRGHRGAWQVTAAARAVELAPWLSALSMVPQAPRELADWVAKAHPRARIDSAAFAWNEGGGLDATVKVSGIRAAASGAIPGVTLARAVVRADHAAVSVEVPAQPVFLALTDVFRKPLPFNRLGGTFVAWRQDGRWNLAAEALHFELGGLAGNGRAHLVGVGRGKRPFVSASIALEHAAVKDATRFLPYRNMPPHLVAWLDHALVGGEVTSARVLIRGDLGHWPFPDHQGRFEATGVVHDATFDFSDQWPRATEVDAAMDFVDNHMGIVATHVKVQGVVATHAVATIPDLNRGVLDLDVKGSGTGAQLLDFVRHTPVGQGAIDALTGLTMGGTGKFAFKLSIPLDHADQFSLEGKVDLAKADVTAAKWNLALKNLAGQLLIDGKGFHADDLTAMLRGVPARLSMRVGSAVRDPADLVEASLDATASAQTLVRGYPGLGALVAHASGAAPFHIGVRVVSGTGNAPATQILNVQSSLAGIALDFPAPLDKPADTPLPLDLTLRLPPNGAPLTVSLGDVLQVRGRLADPARNLPTALAMNFGSTLPTAVPASGLVVTGSAPQLDVSGWIQQAMGGGPAAGVPQLVKAHVATADAQVFGTALGPLTFDYAAGAKDDTIAFDGKVIRGTLQLPTSELMTRGLTAKIAYLHWPEPPTPKQPFPATPPPVTSPIAPAAIPPLHVTIGDLAIGQAKLGAITFDSTSTAAGMRIERFDARGAGFTIQSHGDWDGTRASSQSHFITDVSAHDFGQMLKAFGFSGVLAGGTNAQVHLDGTWPGAPSSFSLAWMQGRLSIRMGEGRLVAVKPGLGRLLGLLSLRDLPSRLTFHFGDVFKSGFGFNEASANFTLKDGSAYTRDLVIAAPAAKIAMYGRVGFRAHDFNLTVDATPHVGGTLPVFGAVIGGPVGAAAGLVVQGLLGKGINKAAGSIYRVTGSWDKPEITTVASAPAPAPAATVASGATVPDPPDARIPAPADPASTAGPPAARVPAPAASTAPAAPASSGR